MDTKLTLSIDINTVNRAKKYAKRQGRSLSDLVENLLKAVTSNEKIDEEEFMSRISPEIRELIGIIKAPKDFDYKKEIGNAIWEKHMK